LNRAVLILISLFWLPAAPAAQLLRVGSFDYYPAIFRDDDGRTQGFFVDLLQAAAEQEGWKLTFVHGSWDAGLARLEAGEVDLLTSVAYTPERAAFMDYCEVPLISVWSEVYVPSQSPVTSVADLEGRRVGVMRGDFNAVEFQRHVRAMGVQCELVELADFRSIFVAMRDGHIDAGVVNSTVGAARGREYGARGTSIILSPFDIYFTTGKGQLPEVREALDRLLRTWKTDPDSIYYLSLQQWLRRDVDVRHELPEHLRSAIYVVLLLLLGSWITVLVERRLVRSRTRELASSQRHLAASEHRTRLLFDELTSAVFLVDPSTGRYLDANTAAAELTGRSVEELVTLRTEDVSPQGSGERLKTVAGLDAAVSLGEVTYLRPDGSRRIALLSVVPLPDGLCFGIATDITARKEAEESLRASEARLRAVIDAAPFGAHLYELDEDGELIFVGFNISAERILGVPHTGFIGQAILSAFPDLAGTDIPDHYERVARTGQPYEGEQISYDHNDIRGAFEVRAVQTGPGKVAAFFRDVTAQRRAEDALRQSEARFRELADMLPQIVFETDLEGRLTFVNQNALAAFGYSAEELAAGLSALDMIVREERPRATEGIQHALTREGPTDGTEYTALRRDGTQFPVVIYSRRRLRNGKPIGLSGIMIDLTDRKREEAERQRLETQLVQASKMESVGRLAGGVAHDFNNMLNVILGHAELVLHDLPEDSPIRDDLEQIRRAGTRSANLTQQLLAFARRQAVVPQTVDLNANVEAMLRILGRLIGEDVTLVWQPSARLAPIRIDPGQLDQILANLAVNARDAIGPAGGRLTIATGSVEFEPAFCESRAGLAPGRYVTLTVADDGCGMDEATLAMIFEPFFTTKDVGEGTGLGLATVYGIVRQNEGWIDVESAPGQGTTFRLCFPEHRDELVPEDPLADQPASVAPHHATILVVEDEPALLQLARRVLERAGHTVLVAATPGEAIALAERHAGEIDLLVTDVIMPEMNGRVLADTLQSRHPLLHRLFMSGYTANVIAAQGVLNDDEPFLPKPFTPQSLITKVQETLAAPRA